MLVVIVSINYEGRAQYLTEVAEKNFSGEVGLSIFNDAKHLL